MRKALNYAINREELWKYGAKGNAYNLGGFVPEEGLGHCAELAPYTYDRQRARDLLKEAGYGSGFTLQLITYEAWKLEAQIIKRMLERVGIIVNLEIMTFPEYYRRIYMPLLETLPERQDWDLTITHIADYYGHSGASLLNMGFMDGSDHRWTKFDPVYEGMWKDMAETIDLRLQEEKMRKMVRYLHQNAQALFIYTPLTLYAVNREVAFVPQKNIFLRLKETSVTENHWSVRGKKN